MVNGEKAFYILSVLVCILESSSCYAFQHADGKKSRGAYLAGDQYRLFKDSMLQYVSPFRAEEFNRPDAIHKIQQLSAGDLRSLAERRLSFVVLVWNPPCPASSKMVRMACALEAMHIPVMMISLCCNYPAIGRRVTGTPFSRKPTYMIPSGEQYRSKMLLKQVAFFKELSPECYDLYRDDVMRADIWLFHDGKIIPVFEETVAEEIERSLKE